jgi:hypothetical protein
MQVLVRANLVVPGGELGQQANLVGKRPSGQQVCPEQQPSLLFITQIRPCDPGGANTRLP